jgi:hypothetical protein
MAIRLRIGANEVNAGRSMDVSLKVVRLSGTRFDNELCRLYVNRRGITIWLPLAAERVQGVG